MTHRSTFCSPWRSLNTVEYFHLRGSSEFQFSNSHLDKIVQFCSRSSTLARIVCFDTFLGSSSTLIRLCFQTKMMFPISRICFQTLFYVSNILFLFLISDVCFQYTFFVSKRKWCFQTTMFPMYVSNIHGARFYYLIKVICSLETWIGNIVDWKHRNRLETKKVHWKH